MESINITASNREDIYKELLPQIEAMVSSVDYYISNLANVTAALKEAFDFYWVGFYIVRDGELVLGPFQGPPACIKIGYGKGVCGSVWKGNKTLVVPDVDKFPGHIACSSFSRSEIVVPLRNDAGEVVAVLDIDSKEFSDFGEVDVLYLEKVVAFLSWS